jgi:phage terminase large subunit-like protein
LTPVTPAELRRSDGEFYADIIDATCRITKDSIAGPRGTMLVTRPWQRQLLKRTFARRADGRLRHRTALWGVPRKNGKSEIAAGIAIGNMLLGPQGGEIYSCAADKAQASIIFRTAKQMVEMDEHLSGAIRVFRDAIEVPVTGTVYRALSAEAFTKEGLNPSLVLFDELHAQPTRELWDVMRLAMGARVEPLLLAITTAGVRTDRTGMDSICYSMYQHGVRVARGEVDDPTFFLAWWEPRGGVDAPHREVATWREANPGFNDLVGEADFRSVVAVTPENEFRIKRTNQWVASGKVWLPHGAWDAIADADRYPGGPPDGARVCIGLDGSKTADSTALIGVTVEDRPHVFVVGVWEKDPYNPAWQVPREEVKNVLREAAARWDVVEAPWDPYIWQDAAAELHEEGLPIEEYPQSPERMGKATQAFYEAVTLRTISHDANPVLARHVANAVPKPTSAGFARITKEDSDSPRKIDAAVTAVFTLDRALWRAQQPVKRGPRIW